MRFGHWVLLLGAVLVGLSGCGGPAAGADRKPQAGPSPTRWPAATAGGACQLLDFDQIASVVGTSFDVAAASQTGATYTCVVEQTRAKLPDLSLSVTSTQADVGIFKSTVVPAGAAAVADLGKSGYSATVPPAAGAGPGVEVGWLSGNQRLITLRLRTPAGSTTAGTAALLPKLVTLARQIDMTTV
ncbi:MAG: hypothetical protein V7603_2741 [Micromonosporaceae bacterium]|jgi:hypothetical protein